MKRIFLIVLAFILLSSPSVWAGSVTGNGTLINTGDKQYKIVLKCTGVISDTIINPTGMVEAGLYLYRVIVESLAADAAVTNNSDVYIYDLSGTDLLSGDGVDQLDDSTRNYIQLSAYEPIIGSIKLSVANQAEAAGIFTVTLILVK